MGLKNVDLYFLGFPAIFEVPGWQKRILQVQEYRFYPWNHENTMIFHGFPRKFRRGRKVKSPKPLGGRNRTGNFSVDTVVGNELAEVVIFPTVEGHSTTRIIDEDINNGS